MLISMTGFGQSEVSDENFSVSAEIRTVNHRFLDFSIKIPKSLNKSEREIKDLIKKKINRGRISVSISVDGGEEDYIVRMNTAIMESYLRELKRFAGKHKLEKKIDINTLALLPDVFTRVEKRSISPKRWALVKKAIDRALSACIAMRKAEGRALEKDIKKRIGRVERIVAEMVKLAPKALEASKRSFKARLDKLVSGAGIDKDRWAAEVSILAERIDFTEEIIRLKSHIAQFKECLVKSGVVSKKLTYILQEIHREAATIGAKASNSTIIRGIVELKEEAEKLREQIQNVE